MRLKSADFLRRRDRDRLRYGAFLFISALRVFSSLFRLHPSRFVSPSSLVVARPAAGTPCVETLLRVRSRPGTTGVEGRRTLQERPIPVLAARTRRNAFGRKFEKKCRSDGPSTPRCENIKRASLGWLRAQVLFCVR